MLYQTIHLISLLLVTETTAFLIVYIVGWLWVFFALGKFYAFLFANRGTYSARTEKGYYRHINFQQTDRPRLLFFLQKSRRKITNNRPGSRVRTMEQIAAS